MTPTRFPSLRWLALAAPLPALVLGVVLMHRHSVASVIWGQNLAAGLLLTVVCAGLLMAAPLFPKRLWWEVSAIFCVGLLLLTFADAGVDGVHRWVQAGPLRLHAGAVGLPVLIIAMSKAWVAPNPRLAGWVVSLLGLGVTGLLALQPDAAQDTAFGGALLTLLMVGRRASWVVFWPVALAVLAGVVWAWRRPDPLSPVPHVEGIVGLAAQGGSWWLLAALASLAVLPLPFLFARSGDEEASGGAWALGVYFGLSLVAPWFGSFPVPLLGFGLSPIVGYYLALAWLVAHRPVPTLTSPRAERG